MPKNPDITYSIENLYYKNKVKKFSIYTVVIIAVFLIFLLLPIIKVDVSAQSRGMIRSISEDVPVSSIVSGRITNINIHNNQNIEKGDTLLILETATLDVETSTNIELKEDLEAILEDLKRVTSGDVSNFETSEIQREYQAYIQQYQEAKALREQAQRSYNRNNKLYRQGVISVSEMDKYEYDLKLASTSLRALEQQQQASWQTQKREIEQQIKNYKGAVSQLEANRDNYYITAPIKGSIVNFSGIQKGAFLSDGIIIAQISAQDSLRVETYVSPNDIGLIREGQKVKFQIDAYNYNQWGMISGEVVDIDQSITVESSGEAFFKVWCRLDKNHLELKNGYEGVVKKGMTLTTRFIIDRRSLWDLLYDKIDDWLNPRIITRE